MKKCQNKGCRQQHENQKYCSKECWREKQRRDNVLQKVCPNCGEDFEVPKSWGWDYCCRECAEEDRAYVNEGENHRWHKGGKKEVQCENCGETLERWPSRIDKDSNFFCDQDCQGQWNSHNNTGEDHPKWKEYPEYACQECGITFKRKPSYHNPKYCSQECSQKNPDDCLRGSNHPNWKGGWKNYYGQNWRQTRRKVWEIDGFKCAFCGRETQEIGRRPDVHHIFRKEMFPKPEDANYIGNLVSLCPRHHLFFEGKFVSPRLISKILERRKQ